MPLTEDILKEIGEAVAKVVLDILTSKGNVPAPAAQKTANVAGMDAITTARMAHPPQPQAQAKP
jgi:2-polyprenyl-3-methyl-5-hydroxy-6-metoxy-1,4-benzoquinol methylase